MTNLEVIATVRAHLLQQNAKSINRYGRCLYRGPEGRKCAIGCLIPDEKYDPAFEGFAFHPAPIPSLEIPPVPLKQISLLAAAGLEAIQLPLGRRLQAIHDAYTVEEWPFQLDLIEAEERNTLCSVAHEASIASLGIERS